MSTNYSRGPRGPLSPVQAQADPAVANAAFSASRGSPEGRYLDGPGKLFYRRISDLKEQRSTTAAASNASQGSLQRAESTDRKRKQNQRGGDRPWPLRLLILVAILAEGVTAYVGMEVLVGSTSLAAGLSVLAATTGGGMACIFANRRLNQHDVPATARIVEAIFVIVMTALRYDSLRVQGADFLAAASAAALAALISALGLLGVEEIIVETRPFGIFVSTVMVSWTRWRSAAAAVRLARIQAKIEAAVAKLQRHFLDYLLKTEGYPLDQAQRRVAAFKSALTDSEV